VIEARSRATAIQATPELINDPEAFDKFQKAQGELSRRPVAPASVVGRAVSEPARQPGRSRTCASPSRAPENRITVARNRYVQTVADYNVKARSFPTNLTAMMFGYKVKPNFTGRQRGADLGAAVGQLRQASRLGAALIAAFALDSGPAMRSFVAAVLLAFAAGLAWAQGVLPVPPLTGRGDRPDRHADPGAGRGADEQARGDRDRARLADRDPDRADDRAGRRRLVRAARRASSGRSDARTSATA
jgi:hypothetical protein